MYTEGFKEGEPYTSLTRCITINLVSQGFKLNDQVHSVYSILEQKNHQLLTDLLEIHFLNLSAAYRLTGNTFPKPCIGKSKENTYGTYRKRAKADTLVTVYKY